MRIDRSTSDSELESDLGRMSSVSCSNRRNTKVGTLLTLGWPSLHTWNQQAYLEDLELVLLTWVDGNDR